LAGAFELEVQLSPLRSSMAGKLLPGAGDKGCKKVYEIFEVNTLGGRRMKKGLGIPRRIECLV
jgi:hypothetical protein